MSEAPSWTASRPIGDECYVCPSCGNHLGGYGRSAKGARVVNHGVWMAVDKEGTIMPNRRYMDLCRCEDCGVVFAVDANTVPED